MALGRLHSDALLVARLIVPCSAAFGSQHDSKSWLNSTLTVQKQVSEKTRKPV